MDGFSWFSSGFQEGKKVLTVWLKLLVTNQTTAPFPSQ
jgi:hypothetical protein